ncbi:HET-domain-containing protein [Hyaloscypha variabilis F]|uniref:HET-domain-containing protein n=1 Tax=Hyaloscypha variabilis (strain UAMH 11265 / GT02V1 / F) TaxID=1149755 RepID=A0A2J6SB23_HYAVF|nr:HET-domain-containing protein [Hyaloscypha variabilis F]
MSAITERGYQHTPLPQERYIRLLQIIQDHTEHLSITLDAFPLDNLPEYEALSYTWGKATCEDPDHDPNDPGSSRQILIHHRPFTISENLNDGLHRLRNDARGYLWIDALCIDQTDSTERASQVLLMGDIYSSAKGVIVWLGKQIPVLDDVLWLIERYLPTVEDPQFSAATSTTDDLLSLLQIPRDKWARLWGSHRVFYASCRWFSRAWIVQEFLLAREITMLCGEKTIDWPALLLLTERSISLGQQIGENGARYGALCSTRVHFPFIGGIPSQKMIDQMSSTLQCKSPEENWCAIIIVLMHIIWHQNSSCAHDKVYSLFGMAQKSQPSSLLQAPALRVDYEKTPEDAFISFTTLLMTKLPTLAMLSYMNRDHRHSKASSDILPSWCPNYAIIRKIFPVLSANQGVASGLEPFAASGDLVREHSSCEIKGHILWVSGKRIALVTKTGQALRPIFAPLDRETFLAPNGIEELLKTCHLLDSTYTLTAQDRLEVLWRTILLDRDYLPGHKWQYLNAEIFSLAFSAFLSLQASLALGNMEDKQRESYLQVLKSRESHFSATCASFPRISEIVEHAERFKSGQLDFFVPMETTVDIFLLRAQISGSGRKLFVTPEKWLGSGPELLEPGDEIWLLKNAAVPFILRPTGDSQYQLVGEAYVHGIMYGELVDAPGGREGFHDIAIV